MTDEEAIEHELTVLRLEPGDLVLVYADPAKVVEHPGWWARFSQTIIPAVSRRRAYIVHVPHDLRLEHLSERDGRALYRRLRGIYGRGD